MSALELAPNSRLSWPPPCPATPPRTFFFLTTLFTVSLVAALVLNPHKNENVVLFFKFSPHSNLPCSCWCHRGNGCGYFIATEFIFIIWLHRWNRLGFPLLLALDWLLLYWASTSISWEKNKIDNNKQIKLLKNEKLKPPWFLSNLLPSNWVTSTGLVLTKDRCLIWVHSRAFWDIFSNTTTIGWTPHDFGPFLYLLIRIKSDEINKLLLRTDL